jgi:hypothetical protein
VLVPYIVREVNDETKSASIFSSSWNTDLHDGGVPCLPDGVSVHGVGIRARTWWLALLGHIRIVSVSRLCPLLVGPLLTLYTNLFPSTCLSRAGGGSLIGYGVDVSSLLAACTGSVVMVRS